MAYKHTFAFASLGLFNRVDSQTTTREYRSRQAIFAQGNKADAMFYIRNGNVKLTVVSKRGKKAAIAIFRRGDFFGEACLTGQPLRTSTAMAMQPSTIARVKRRIIVRIIRKDLAFAKLFMSYLLFRMGESKRSSWTKCSVPAKNDRPGEKAESRYGCSI
jgi:CRP-like cAMP-binding protein